MQGHKNPGTLAAEIKMMRTQSDCAVLVVEGSDDLAFWRAHKVDECEAVMAEGKPNAIGCMVRLEAEAVHGVLAVVDADYDVLMGPTARAFSHRLCGFWRAALVQASARSGPITHTTLPGETRTFSVAKTRTFSVAIDRRQGDAAALGRRPPCLGASMPAV